MPTPLYLNGFENRVLLVGGSATDAIWSAVTGPTNVTVSSDATVFRGAGARSLKLVLASGVASQAIYASDAFAGQTLLANRFYFRKSGNPSGNIQIEENNVAAGIFFTTVLNTSGQLFIDSIGGTTPVDGGTTAALSDNTWYLVDIVIDVTTVSYVARMWLDGTVVASDATVTGAGAGSITATRVGKLASSTITTSRDIYFDDLIVGTASSITDKFGATDGIVGLVPNADGTHSPAPPTAGRFKDAGGTDISGGNPAWDNLDSGDLTQTAERVDQQATAATEYLEVGFTTTTLSAAAPVAVQGEVGLGSSGTAAFTGKTSIFNGAAETIIFSGDWSTGTKWYKRNLVTVADQTALDGLTARIGFGGAIPDIPRWEALMIEVDIGAAAPGTGSLLWTDPSPSTIYIR